MQTKKTIIAEQGTMKSYIVGFLLSLILTLIPYFLVADHLLAVDIIATVIVIFAFLQLLVQMLFFLHMRKETNPRWKLVFFISFFSIIIIVVVASIWIMQHLNYNMSLIQFNNLMQSGEGF